MPPSAKQHELLKPVRKTQNARSDLAPTRSLFPAAGSAPRQVVPAGGLPAPPAQLPSGGGAFGHEAVRGAGAAAHRHRGSRTEPLPSALRPRQDYRHRPCPRAVPLPSSESCQPTERFQQPRATQATLAQRPDRAVRGDGPHSAPAADSPRRHGTGPPPLRYLHRSSKTLLGISARLVSMGKRGSSRRGEARTTVQRRGRGSLVPALWRTGRGGRGVAAVSPNRLAQAAPGCSRLAAWPDAVAQSAGELLRERDPQVIAGGGQWPLLPDWGVIGGAGRVTGRYGSRSAAMLAARWRLGSAGPSSQRPPAAAGRGGAPHRGFFYSPFSSPRPIKRLSSQRACEVVGFL